MNIYICKRCGHGQVGDKECQYCLTGHQGASIRPSLRILLLTAGLLLLGVDTNLRDAELDQQDFTQSFFTSPSTDQVTMIDPVSGLRVPAKH